MKQRYFFVFLSTTALCALAFVVAVNAGPAQTSNLGIFANQGGVGQTTQLRIVRQGSRFTMYAGKPGEELKVVGPVEFVSLKDPVYVGLGVCSHTPTTLETAIFSNVKLEESPTKP